MNNKLRIQNLIGTLLLMIVCSGVLADDIDEFKTYQQKYLGTLQNEFKKIRKDHPNNTELKLFRSRLELLNEVASLLISRYQSTKSSSLQNLLDDIGGLPQTTTNVQQPSKTNYLSAIEVLEEYQEAFAQGLPRPDLPEKDLKTLMDYYTASARVAGSYIPERGRLVGAIDPRDSIDILQLCLVMPFLHVSDVNWSEQNIRDLPDWMKTPENLSHLENYALRVRRTHTAYRFMLSRVKLNNLDNLMIPVYSDYLMDAATRLVDAREYHAGIYCIKSAIALALGEKNQDTVIKLRFQLAQILYSMGHHPLAVQEMKEILVSYPKSESCARAGMLYMKYLYESRQYAKIIQEASAFYNDSRFKPYLPQILYISWVTFRHEDQLEEANKIQTKFLGKYPDNILAADMYFASAMEALAISNYDEVSRIFELIEYRYPAANVTKKMKKIQKQIAENLKTSTSKSY